MSDLNYTTSDQKGDTTSITIHQVDQIKKDFERLEKDFIQIREEMDKSKRDVDRTNNFMYVVVIFVAVSFIVAVFSIYWDGILSNKSDKDLYLKYNEIFKNYSDQNFELKDKVYEQEININNLKNEVENLRIRNPYLK